MKISLPTLLYTLTVCTASLATFGAPTGALVAVGVLAVWGKVLGVVRGSWITIGKWFALAMVIWALILPAFSTPVSYGPSLANMSRNVAKQIVLAMHNYNDLHGSFPPPYSVDSTGTPLHSWRTLLWPFVEEESAWRQLDQANAWNGTANEMLTNLQFDIWESYRQCDTTFKGTQTHFFAVVDDATIWPTNQAINLNDIPDGAHQTIAVIEVDRSDIHAMEPRDLTLDEAIALLGHGPEQDRATLGLPPRPRFQYDDRSWSARNRRLVAFADGHVEILSPLDPATARALLTRAGGELITKDKLDQYRRSPEFAVVEWDPRASYLIFGIIALLPAIVRSHVFARRLNKVEIAIAILVVVVVCVALAWMMIPQVR